MHKTFIRDDSQIEANHDSILLLFPLSKLRTLDQEPGVTEPNPNSWNTQGQALRAPSQVPRASHLGPFVLEGWIWGLLRLIHMTEARKAFPKRPWIIGSGLWGLVVRVMGSFQFGIFVGKTLFISLL